MFESMRRKDRELSSSEVESLLCDGEYGVLTWWVGTGTLTLSQ